MIIIVRILLILVMIIAIQIFSDLIINEVLDVDANREDVDSIAYQWVLLRPTLFFIPFGFPVAGLCLYYIKMKKDAKNTVKKD